MREADSTLAESVGRYERAESCVDSAPLFDMTAFVNRRSAAVLPNKVAVPVLLFNNSIMDHKSLIMFWKNARKAQHNSSEKLKRRKTARIRVAVGPYRRSAGG